MEVWKASKGLAAVFLDHLIFILRLADVPAWISACGELGDGYPVQFMQ